MNKKTKEKLTLKERLISAGIIVATLAGTFDGNDGWPLVGNEKYGNSYGINIGLINEFNKDSTFYGINIGFINKFRDGSNINGLNLGIANYIGGDWRGGSDINGVSISAVNHFNGGNLNGLTMSIIDSPYDSSLAHWERSKINGVKISGIALPYSSQQFHPVVNGLQMGFLNSSYEGNSVQLGVYNTIKKNDGKIKRGFLINHHFRGRDKKGGRQ